MQTFNIRRNRLRFEAQFTQIPNIWLRDDRLKAGALGLLVYLLSHSEEFNLSLQFIANRFGVGRDAIRSQVRILEETGYLVREQSRNDKGQITGWSWYLHDPFDPQAQQADITESPASPSPAKTPKTAQNHRSEPPSDFPTVGLPSAGKSDAIEEQLLIEEKGLKNNIPIPSLVTGLAREDLQTDRTGTDQQNSTHNPAARQLPKHTYRSVESRLDEILPGMENYTPAVDEPIVATPATTYAELVERIDTQLFEIHPSLSVIAIDCELKGRLDPLEFDLVTICKQILAKTKTPIAYPPAYIAVAMINNPDQLHSLPAFTPYEHGNTNRLNMP